MLQKEATIKKAELINSGVIKVQENIEIPVKASESSAGPDAGKKSIILSFDNSKVRMKIGKNSIFSLKKIGDNFQIFKNGKLFLDNVKIIPTILHAPNQAFINIEHRCIYNCKFCSSPFLKRKKRTKEEIIEKIVKASRNNNFEAVAITSGVAVSEEYTTNEIVEIIKEIKKRIGNVIIGVEPCTTNFLDIEKLKKAGASEIKLNIQSFDREIFKKICPKRGFDEIISAIKYSVKIFGKNNVCSNIIIGVGESNKNVIDGIEYLAKIGAVATIRAIRIDEINLKPLKNALGMEVISVSPQRLLYLAKKQKEILENYNLSTTSFKTMCHRCTCCDIVPGIDI